MISMIEYANALLASMAAAQTDNRKFYIDGSVSVIDPMLPEEPEDDPRTNEPPKEPDDE